MALELVLSPQAISDIEEIYTYSFLTWSAKQADNYQDEISDHLSSLAINPNLGPEYPFAKENYRYSQINRHIVFYRVSPIQLIVVRILHEKMRLDNWI